MDVTETIRYVVARLREISGIEAVVLGGSRARGTHTPSSDVDVGIYYDPSTPLDLPALRLLATELDDAHRSDLITEIGGWGPWINGGGWLTINNVPVDFLFRDLGKVAQIIKNCRNGQLEIAYQPGHPHAFVSSMYLSEIALCQILWDPRQTLAGLKAQAIPYPPQLKQALIATFAWEADFSVNIAKKSVARGDVAYAAGCCFRSVVCLAQTLFALNEQYWMNEKGAIALAATFPQCPPQFRERVERIFQLLNEKPEAIAAALETLGHLVTETSALVSEKSKP